jgi:hypothetical protein
VRCGIAPGVAGVRVRHVMSRRREPTDAVIAARPRGRICVESQDRQGVLPHRVERKRARA